MSYIDGFVIAVPTANKQKFIAHANRGDSAFIERGATRVVECWGADVPKGKTTDFQGAVAAKDERKAIRLLEESGATWLCAEWLPAYAPDLNPVEALWSCTKYGDLANFTPDDLDDLGNEIGDSFARQSQNSALKNSYFQTAKLQL